MENNNNQQTQKQTPAQQQAARLKEYKRLVFEADLYDTESDAIDIIQNSGYNSRQLGKYFD